MDLATIGFKADTSGIYKANKGLDDLSKQGAKTDKAMSGAGASIGRSFAGVAAAVGGLVSASAAMQKLVSVSREFDVLNAGLITATGSAEKAGQAFKAIEDFATTTPYSLAQATKAFTQLVNLGLTPSEAALTSYGNTAAAMGKDLSQMVEAVADATVGEFERLKEFGIKARAEGDNVSFTFRGMTTTVKKSADEIEGYLIGLGQNEFAGAMANRMNTLDGAISNLSDSWDGLFRTISSQGAGDAITSGIRMATDAIGELTDSIASGQLAGYIDALGAKFSGWGRDIASVLDFVGGLFADAGEYWYLDMSESARLIIDAFKNIPENIRAFIQIATIELSAFVDGVAVYGKAIASYLDITEASVDISKEFERISAARAASIGAIMNERQAALESFNSQITSADGLRTKYDELNGSVDTAVDRLEQYKAVVTDSAKATAGLSKELSKLDDAALDYFDALEELDQIEKDRISRKEEAIDAMLEPFEEGEKAVEQYATISEKAAERIESAFSDAWVNAFDGFESVVDGMKNAFKRMLAEMAHMALTKPIMVSLGMGDMMGAGSAGTSAISSALGKNALFASASAYLGPMAAVASLAAMLSKALGGSGKNGALLGGVTGGLLGSWKTESDMLNLGISGGSVTGSQTTTNVKKKFFKNRRESFTTDFDVSGIDAAFDAISSALSESAQIFGITGADEIIKGFSAAANINIKGKSQEEVQAAISEWVGNTTGALVNAVFGDSLQGLQREGEGVIDTVNRLSMNMSAVQSIAKTLGVDFDLTGKAAMIASTNIVELAGGIDQLSALTSQYYSAFYSETEQQNMLTQQLAAEFAKLNTAMPTTREGFRGIVDGLDLTTESGQAAFAALMQLVPGMDQYLSSVELQKSAAEQAAKATEQAAKAAEQAAAAALKEAEARASALESQGFDLQLRLYDALGKSSEALTLRRQLEVAATDESLRSMLIAIYAAQDAAQAQKELASAQAEASQIAQDAAEEAARAAQERAEEATKLAEQTAETIAKIQQDAADKTAQLAKSAVDLQMRIYNALGDSSASLALARERELAAADESLRSLLLQVYAAEDAATANQQLLESLQGAANAAQQLQAAAEGLLDSSFGRLKDAYESEKKAIAETLKVKLAGLDSEQAALEAQASLVQNQYTEQSAAAERYVDRLKEVRSVLDGFVDSSAGASAPFKRLTQILSEARGGLTPDAGELGAVLSAIQSNGSAGFSSAQEQAFANAVAKNQAIELGNIVGQSESVAAGTLEAITQQSTAASSYYAQQLQALEQQRLALTSDAEQQIAALDAQLLVAEKQYNALMGIDGRMLSVSDALAEFTSAMAGVESARAANQAASAQLSAAQLAVISSDLFFSESMLDIQSSHVDIAQKQIEELMKQTAAAQLQYEQASSQAVVAELQLEQTTKQATFVESQYYALVKQTEKAQEQAQEQVAVVEKVEAAIIDLRQTVVDLMPVDSIWLPPVGTQTPMSQELTQEMVVLLRELVAGNEAIAKHTKTTADVLELEQFESQEAAV